MKRISTIVITLAVAVALASPALASGTFDQLKGGAKDVIASPLQIRDNVVSETKDTKLPVYPLAFVGGLLKGSFYMGKQIVTGTWHMVTSPLEMTK